VGRDVGVNSVLKFGKDEIFFDLLDQQARVAQEAAQAFLVLVGDMESHEKHAATLLEIEHKGDDLTHKLQNILAKTFITPVDAEDLSELSHVLDDITDYIEAVGARIDLYRLKVCRPDLPELADQLVEITALVASAIAEVRGNFAKSSTLTETLVKIHTVENNSDTVFRRALGTLFHESDLEILSLMKWKEVYERVESAMDRCEDVAKVLDNMIVKYA